ncbi:hypothetical protein [Mycobacterium riyadhense]|uniref:hypothetical protein n=1 Tax=Mycobacterium riyadhense TaxID=486698 RepID=UPI00195D782F|nr:hypothetical protein [Mycobacterium riyadhense]
MDQKFNNGASRIPDDARKSTEEQREIQQQLEHQGDDPDAPGLHQSRRDVADETRSRSLVYPNLSPGSRAVGIG